jgi:mRNA interferase MazF
LNSPRQRPVARRGEVWFVRPDTVIGAEIQKQRPMVIVRRSLATEHGLTTLVVPFTDSDGKIAGVIRPLIGASRGSGLSKDSLAACDQVRCVDRIRLINKIGQLASPEMEAVLRGLFEILDLGGPYEI